MALIATTTNPVILHPSCFAKIQLAGFMEFSIEYLVPKKDLVTNENSNPNLGSPTNQSIKHQSASHFTTKTLDHLFLFGHAEKLTLVLPFI